MAALKCQYFYAEQCALKYNFFESQERRAKKKKCFM